MSDYSGNVLRNEIAHQIGGINVVDALKKLADLFPGGAVFSSSFSFEDQYIAHLILSNSIGIEIFTLDTGRLFMETYSVWSSTLSRYGKPIKAYFPDPLELESFVANKGPNAFYESLANRKECCRIRKVGPLKRALAGKKIWVTGLRAEHSPERHGLEEVEWDPGNEVVKYHPLLHWTTEAVREQIELHNIPYNPLHDRGFVSIGCLPCTRAIKPGEDFRAGRWWWEDADKKECGLHEHK